MAFFVYKFFMDPLITPFKIQCNLNVGKFL